MTKESDGKRNRSSIPVGIAIGVALGAALNSMGAGLLLGVAIGAAMDVVRNRRQKKESQDSDD